MYIYILYNNLQFNKQSNTFKHSNATLFIVVDVSIVAVAFVFSSSAITEVSVPATIVAVTFVLSSSAITDVCCYFSFCYCCFLDWFLFFYLVVYHFPHLADMADKVPAVGVSHSYISLGGADCFGCKLHML